ncbi:hypothetical protein GGR55DRAFT_700776 [Xylaria sp. FL0064]|nr:hypothetical protein GGR55DRAFT_700776 [Xylaria sp. FL0064]
MNPSKRQRSADEDDDSAHASKKVAMSDEVILVQQNTTTAPNSNIAKFASQEPIMNHQDTETAGKTTIPRAETVRDSQDSATPTTNANIQLGQTNIAQEATTARTDMDSALESSKNKPPHDNGYIEKIERRLDAIESTLSQVQKSLDKHQPKQSPDVTKSNALIKELATEKNQLQSVLGTAHSETRAVYGKMKTAQGELEAVRAERDALREEAKELRRQNKLLEEDLEMFVFIKQSAPDLDMVLGDQFSDLRATIRSFTRGFCDKKISIKSVPDHVVVAFKALSGITPSSLLKSSFHARYFVEGLIWRILCESILGNPFNIWGTNYTIGTLATKVESNVGVAASMRQLWRTMTGQLLSTKGAPAKSKIILLQDHLVSYLKPLVRGEFNGLIQGHVEKIVKDATELASTLCQSRTLCVIYRKEPNADGTVSQQYNSKWMDIIEKSVNHYDDVDFIVSPALVQLTNSAGDEFKSPRVMYKAEVCFGQGVTSADDHPISTPALYEKGQTKMAPSGRQARAVKRYGNAANENQVIEALGNHDERSPTGSSDEYQDKTSPPSKRSRRT